MKEKHTYTAREVMKMRMFSYRIAQRLFKNEGRGHDVSKESTDTEAMIADALILSENVLQSFIMAGISYKELIEEYSLIDHGGIS